MAYEMKKADTAPKAKFSVQIKTEAYQNLINDTLGDKDTAKRFVAEISTVVSLNPSLQECDSKTILSAGLLAQTMNLPLSPSLGFCHIIPYGKQAQFQIGWKGLVQLAQRTGQYKRIGVRPVHEGEWLEQDKYGEDIFNFSHEYDNNKVIGYFAYFELVTGFEKTIYWTKEQCDKHAKAYSKSYGTGKSTDNWTNKFDEMAMKTVIKQLISKWGPMSVELQKAIVYDQSAIGNDGTIEYVDSVEFVEEETPDLSSLGAE